MVDLGLRACEPRAYKITTQPDPDAAGPQDLLERDFTADTPGQKLVGDITYVRTWQGWLYLAECCGTAIDGVTLLLSTLKVRSTTN